jgi:hypothetical protein
MKPNLLLLSSNLLKSTVCSAPFAPSAIALTAVPRRCLGGGLRSAPHRQRRCGAKQPRQKKAEAKGAEQKEFYASPLAKKVQNKENHPDKAEKEIGEIL